jgi:hypothetical protein
VGASATSVDNFPGTTATAGVTVRKPRQLRLAAGTAVAWTLRNDRDDAVLQSGSTVAEAEGLIAVVGLVIPKDPQRVRLEFRTGGATRPGDLDGDGSIDLDDLALMQAEPVDLDGDGVAGAIDVAMLDRYVRRNSCPGDLGADGTVDATDLALLLASWGPCPAACPADLDGDGSIGGPDLAILLANWGACR